MNHRSIVLLLLIVCLTACNTSPPPTPPTFIPTAVPPTSTHTAIPTRPERPTDTPQPTAALQPTFAVLPTLADTSRTGIPIVDEVIEAVFASDEDRLLGSVEYLTLPCSHLIDGPQLIPRCEDSESEGTLLNVFPMSVSEGFYVRSEHLSFSDTLGDYALFAVHYTNEIDQPDWPAGRYAIVLSSKSEDWYATIRLSDSGIVRIGYGPTDHHEFARPNADFILPPVLLPTSVPGN